MTTAKNKATITMDIYQIVFLLNHLDEIYESESLDSFDGPLCVSLRERLKVAYERLKRPKP